jgi:hypothetical protein
MIGYFSKQNAFWIVQSKLPYPQNQGYFGIVGEQQGGPKE